jgi:hypothetical protein
LYQSAAPYGNASIGIVRVEISLQSVNTRLEQIGDSGGATQQ